MEPVVVNCNYSLHVAGRIVINLREVGFDAKYMNSGHYGCQAIGAPTTMRI